MERRARIASDEEDEIACDVCKSTADAAHMLLWSPPASECGGDADAPHDLPVDLIEMPRVRLSFSVRVEASDAAAPRMPEAAEAAETSHLTRHPSIDRIDRRARDEPSPPRESTHLFIRVGLARFARAASLARLARARRLARGVDLEATTATRAS